MVKRTTQVFISSVSVSRLLCTGLSVLTILYVALDPNWKLVYTEDKWDQDFYEAGVKKFEEVVRMLLHIHCHVLIC